MTDQELIELSAKIARISGKWCRWHQAYGDEWIEGLDTGGPVLWNPLVDDGQALRLAVAVANTDDRFHSIVWSWTHRAVRVFVGGCEGYGDDEFAATRRAIVTAAATLAKEMK